MPEPVSIQLRPAQAAQLRARVEAYNQATLRHQEAEADVRELLTFAVAGLAPEGSAFVGLNAETGVLLVQPPES